jgi:hypothetical protein
MPINKAASVSARLKKLAKIEKIDFQRLLNNYATQKFLVRIAKSPYRKNLLLKGSWLFVAWSGSLHRPTKDADMLALGHFDKSQVVTMFLEIARTSLDDGLLFAPDSFEVSDITKDGLYKGFRATGVCFLGNARIKIQIVLGFGDAVIPGSKTETISCVLGGEAAILNAYPIYSAISEKWHAINKLGMTNSRLKDYYDLYVIANLQNLEGGLLSDAIRNTFLRRETSITASLPVGLSAEFYEDISKMNSWKAFLRKNDIPCQKSLKEICELLEAFLLPINLAISNNRNTIDEWSSKKLIWSKKITMD